MGFSISWVGFRAIETPAVLRQLDLHITAPAEMDDAPLLFAEMPSGWSIIFANDVEWASPDRMASLSVGREIIGVIVEEHTDIWAVFGYRDNHLQWTVVRQDGMATPPGLQVSGTIPDVAKPCLTPEWQAKLQPFDRQREPLDVAQAVTGFIHDRPLSWGIPAFRRLESGIGQPLL